MSLNLAHKELVLKTKEMTAREACKRMGSHKVRYAFSRSWIYCVPIYCVRVLILN
jgi:hypothetical protein